MRVSDQDRVSVFHKIWPDDDDSEGVMKIVYAFKVAVHEFRNVMAGRPASKDRIPFLQGLQSSAHDDFVWAQRRMFQFRDALMAIDSDVAREALSTPSPETEPINVEGWAHDDELNDPDDPIVTVYRSETHPHLIDPVAKDAGISIVPVRVTKRAQLEG